MLTNYLRIAIRNLTKQRFYSLINVTGLAVGVAACVIVFVFLQHEFSYDRHFRDADRIHRVIRARQLLGRDPYLPQGLQGPVGPSMVEEIPDLESFSRFIKRPMWAGFEDHGFDVSGAPLPIPISLASSVFAWSVERDPKPSSDRTLFSSGKISGRRCSERRTRWEAGTWSTGSG